MTGMPATMEMASRVAAGLGAQVIRAVDMLKQELSPSEPESMQCSEISLLKFCGRQDMQGHTAFVKDDLAMDQTVAA